jgi:hypothetical protein
MKHKPITLGDKLAPIEPKTPDFSYRSSLRSTYYLVMSFTLLIAVCALSLWWFLMRPDVDKYIMLALIGALIVLWAFVYSGLQALKPRKKTTLLQSHSLLINDHHGFMRDLRLDAKTAIFDGSNIYHFGHDNGLDAQPLGMIAHQLRTEGYRIVCFFDANI